MVYQGFLVGRSRATFTLFCLAALTISACTTDTFAGSRSGSAKSSPSTQGSASIQVQRFASVSSSPTEVSRPGQASFTITLSNANPKSATRVYYTMAGTATRGQDYTLTSSTVVTIPAGATQANVTLVSTTKLTSVNKTAIMSLSSGSGYQPSSASTSSVTILAQAGATPAPTPAPSPTASPQPSATPAPSTTPTPTPTPSASPSPSPTATPVPQLGTVPVWTPAALSPLSQPSAAQAAAAQEVWIAPRTDNQPGTGTSFDPFNGSTADMITARITAVPPFSTVHFAAGTYSISGIVGIQGLKLLGAGKDATILAWNGIMPNGYAMIYSYGLAHGMTISDLTFDGRQSVYGPTPMAVNTFDCNDVTIANVRATNFRGSSVEAFVVTQFAQNSSVTGASINNCEVDHFASGSGGATLLGLQHGGGGSLATRITGSVTNNYIHDCPGVQGLDGGGTNSLYQNNIVDGSRVGLNHDTWLVSNSQIVNNQFLNCGHYGILLKTNASGTDNPSNGCDGFIVANNTVTLASSITADTVGVWIDGLYNTNIQVFGNSVTKNPVTGPWQYGLLLTTGPGLTAFNNSASPGLTNVPAIK